MYHPLDVHRLLLLLDGGGRQGDDGVGAFRQRSGAAAVTPIRLLHARASVVVQDVTEASPSRYLTRIVVARRPTNFQRS